MSNNGVYEAYVNPNRHRLEEVLPLDTTYIIHICASDICNFKCKFCGFQAEEANNYFKKQVMDKSVFEKIVDNCTEFPQKLKVIRFSGCGEPLVNKNIVEMISCARNKNIAERIEIITNGSFLNPTLNRQLVDAGLDALRISIEGIDAKAYKEMANADIDWETFVGNIRDFYEHRQKCDVYIKTVDAAVETNEKEQKFFDTFGSICDKIFIEHIMPIWPDYDKIRDDFTVNENTGFTGQKVQETFLCTAPFYSPIIFADGTVSVCCADLKRVLLVGDASKESIRDIWNSPKYHKFLMEMLEKGYKDTCDICSRCENPKYNPHDNFDKYAEDVLKKYVDRFGAGDLHNVGGG